MAGFDVGSDTSVVALARRKGIDVVRARSKKLEARCVASLLTIHMYSQNFQSLPWMSTEQDVVASG